MQISNIFVPLFLVAAIMLSAAGCGVAQSNNITSPSGGSADIQSSDNDNTVALAESTDAADSSSPGSQRQPDGSEYIAYISDVLPKYLGSAKRFGELSSDDNSSIQISQGLRINGNPDENSRAFIIADNGEYIALLFVSYVDGTFHSSFGLDENDNVAAAIRDRIPIALFVLAIGSLFMQTEHGNFLLSAFENPEDLPKHFPEAFETSYEKAEIVLTSYHSNPFYDFFKS